MEGERPVKGRVGYWMTDKKIKRLNFDNFKSICRTAGIDMVKLNFDRPLVEQGPFNVILHKLTDQLARTQEGSVLAMKHIDAVQSYMHDFPSVTVIDPIDNVMKLLDRHEQYRYVQECDVVDSHYHYFIPSFAEFTTSNLAENKRLLQENGVEYPFVCKPSLSHCYGQTGIPSTAADREEMSIVFSEEGLADVDPPCVVQTFVNHNARLFKIFIIGNYYYIIQRPSIKNFYAGEQKTIFFNSNDVSKSYSASFLNKLEDSEVDYPIIEPDDDKMKHLVQGIQKKFGLDLLGIDVIIENKTGRYAVIDINAFPGYDGVPEFFPALLSLIEAKLTQSQHIAVSLANDCHANDAATTDLQTLKDLPNRDETVTDLLGHDITLTDFTAVDSTTAATFQLSSVPEPVLPTGTFPGAHVKTKLATPVSDGLINGKFDEPSADYRFIYNNADATICKIDRRYVGKTPLEGASVEPVKLNGFTPH